MEQNILKKLFLVPSEVLKKLKEKVQAKTKTNKKSKLSRKFSYIRRLPSSLQPHLIRRLLNDLKVPKKQKKMEDKETQTILHQPFTNKIDAEAQTIRFPRYYKKSSPAKMTPNKSSIGTDPMTPKEKNLLSLSRQWNQYR